MCVLQLPLSFFLSLCLHINGIRRNRIAVREFRAAVVLHVVEVGVDEVAGRQVQTLNIRSFQVHSLKMCAAEITSSEIETM